jgi:hypothetical protein
MPKQLRKCAKGARLAQKHLVPIVVLQVLNNARIPINKTRIQP